MNNITKTVLDGIAFFLMQAMIFAWYIIGYAYLEG